VVDDLRGLFRGTLRVDALSCRLYARDASIFYVEPQVIAIPQDAADVAVLLRYCHEHGVAVIARGAGTGLAGESVGAGVVVDLSVHMQGIRSVEAEAVTVEAGVRWSTLANALACQGRRFAPDPASGGVCTIGGMVATNASGANLFRYGYTRDYVLGVEVVWDNGETAVLSSVAALRGQRPQASPHDLVADTGRTAEIRRSVSELLSAHRHQIACRPTATLYDRCGYRLDDIWTPWGPDLARLLVGSEGTLGIITAVRLRTIPLPGACALLGLGFSSLEAAVRAGVECRRYQPTACDLLDQRLLSLRRHRREDGPTIPAGVAATLLVSFEADSRAAALQQASTFAEAARQQHHALLLAGPTCDPHEHQRLQQWRRQTVRDWYGLGPGPRPVPAIEDLGVPPDALPSFLAALLELLQRREITAAFLLHTLTGQVHLRPLLNLDDPAERIRLWTLAEEVHTLTLRWGGTVSSQHGVGWARTPWVERQVGPLYPLFRELKRIFDPKNLLNPGKIVGPDPSREAWPLYPLPPATSSATAATPATGPATARYALPVWHQRPPTLEAARCSRCGDCRSAPLPQRMCPLFTLNGLELAAPRAKAELFRLLEHSAPAPSLEALTEIADLCFLCEMCRIECDVHVDVPLLMLELKAQLQATDGLRRFEGWISRQESWVRWGYRLAPLSNFVLRRRTGRWLLEKLIGLSRRRPLPPFARTSFFRKARRLGLTTRPPADGRPRWLYFLDLYAAYHDPLLAEAVVAVLQHHECAVYVPVRQRSAGWGPWSVGDVDTLRALAHHNVRLLADAARDGYRILCSEPTAALLLRRYYPLVLDDADSRLVAQHTVELSELLQQWHLRGDLRPPTQPVPLRLAHHTPCHRKALDPAAHAPAWLADIPALQLLPLEAGCSGMAGLWGQHVHHEPLSLRLAAPLQAALQHSQATASASECSACRLQLQQLTGRRAFHPVELLALAYGLLPQLQTRLSTTAP
jgi:FAD/FMN-containing dehydrogenase/Fe-S oxidoreductase